MQTMSAFNAFPADVGAVTFRNDSPTTVSDDRISTMYMEHNNSNNGSHLSNDVDDDPMEERQHLLKACSDNVDTGYYKQLQLLVEDGEPSSSSSLPPLPRPPTSRRRPSPSVPSMLVRSDSECTIQNGRPLRSSSHDNKRRSDVVNDNHDDDDDTSSLPSFIDVPMIAVDKQQQQQQQQNHPRTVVATRTTTSSASSSSSEIITLLAKLRQELLEEESCLQFTLEGRVSVCHDVFPDFDGRRENNNNVTSTTAKVRTNNVAGIVVQKQQQQQSSSRSRSSSNPSRGTNKQSSKGAVGKGRLLMNRLVVNSPLRT